MDTEKRRGRMAAAVPLLTMLLTVVMLNAVSMPACADDKQEAMQLADKARLTLETFMNDGTMEKFRDVIVQAKGVFIVPRLLRGAFVFGASGGSGVLLVLEEQSGEWRGPAFYTIGGVSFGFQIGVEASDVIFLAMSQRGVSAFLSNSFKWGGDAGLAVGRVGAGASEGSANLSGDILSFSRPKGVYAGISMDGAVVTPRNEWNDAYYGRKVTPTDILIGREVTNPESPELTDAVTKASGKK